MTFSLGIVRVNAQETLFTVDLWTDKGGQGENVSGEVYQVGEQITIYLEVSAKCQVGWFLISPLEEDSGEKTLEPGVHPLLEKLAKEADVGEWEIILEARADQEYAFDTLFFQVSEAESFSQESFDLATSLILEDDFNSENQERGTLNYSNLVNWDVIQGSVDLIGHGFWDFFPDYGLYLDLDGSTGKASKLQSKTIFELESGKYQLDFELAGSPMSGPNTVTVSLGSLYQEKFSLNQNEPFSKITREISVPKSANEVIIFEHSGEDNQGLLLDNVKLTKLLTEPPAAEQGVLDLSQASEKWAQEWTIVSTLKDFGGEVKAGFYPQAVRKKGANPNPGREGILYLHPKTQQEPALLKRDLILTGPKPTLKMGVSGNRNVDGDWVLAVKVNGEPLGKEKIITGSQGWQDISFDLSNYSGESAAIEIEVRANDWYYEYAFFDYIKIEDTIGDEPPTGTDLVTPLAAPELIAYWKFDEKTGITAYDSSGYGNHGTIQGATWVTGKFGGALSFDGKDDYLKVPSNPSLDTKNEITLEAWINPEKGNPYPILEYNDGTHAGVHLWQWRRWSDLYANLVNTRGYCLLEAPEVISTGWQHIAVTYDGIYGKLYHNGELVATTKIQWLSLQTTYDFYIGLRPNENRYFKGLIDEVRIYNRGLSQAEIRADMKITQPVVQPPIIIQLIPVLTGDKDVFRLSTGELIMGEFLSFDGITFTIKTEEGVIEKKKEEIITILVGISQ